MDVALVCIAKNEELYIQEWIDYHLKLGFDDIFIYQNNWRWESEQKNVIKYELDGEVQQRIAYNDFIQNNLKIYDWVAFFDVDEFLVLKKHDNVKNFIQQYSEHPSIAINWVLFGNNNIEDTTENFSLIKRFTKRQKNVNFHIKCIVKLTENTIMDIHHTNNNWVDTNNKIGKGPFNYYGDDNIAQLNHYFCKTKIEFQMKCDRGRADTSNNLRTMKDFDEHNFNEIEDLTAHNFFYK